MKIVTATARPHQFLQYDGTNGRYIVEVWCNAQEGETFVSDDGYTLTWDEPGSPGQTKIFGTWFHKGSHPAGGMSHDEFLAGYVIGEDWSTARE